MSHRAGLGEDVIGKDARQLVLADHHFDVHAEVVWVAEDLDEAADGGAVGWANW